MPSFRKATEEVKRLTVKRNKIVNKKPVGSPPRPAKAYVPTMQHGMIPLDKRINLVGSKTDLADFNPPEMWDEMEKQFARNGEILSPAFRNREMLADDQASSSNVEGGDNESQQEYFQFHLEDHNDDGDDDASF